MKRLHFVTICLLMCSCSPRIIENVRVERDTTYISNHVRDSIYFRDSIYVKELVKGDTVYIEKYRDRWRDRIREVHDTTYLSRVDSVAVERIKEVKVEQPIKGWKKVRLWAFLPLLLIALVGWRKELAKLLKLVMGFFS